MDRKELLSSKEYWLSKIQIELFNQVSDYLEKNNMKRSELAKKLGVTKGYISQVLNGDSDHRISKVIELSLAIGLIPEIRFKNLEEYLITDAKCKDKDEHEFIESIQSLQERGYMAYKKGGLYSDNLNETDYSPKKSNTPISA
jgi:transcriptional regulator with XRE-family HTH domain